MSPDQRVIVALDLPDLAVAERMVDTLGDAGTFYKLGYELIYGGGLGFAEALARAGKQVFIDLKLHDIPNTVERGAAQIARLGARFLTVHAYPQTMAAAARATAGSATGILGVSVLTSMDDSDLARAGYGMGVEDLVARRARQAQEAGAEGLVCSPADLPNVRRAVGEALCTVTPGVRPGGSAVGDQKRILTPGEAVRAGADYLVIGRPITAAPDPKAALLAILAEIAPSGA